MKQDCQQWHSAAMNDAMILCQEKLGGQGKKDGKEEIHFSFSPEKPNRTKGKAELSLKI